MEETNNTLKHCKLKRFIHPLLLRLMTLKTTGELSVSGNVTSKNALIVANHFCIEDIPTLGEAVKKHFYLLVSDEDKNTIDGVALGLNGVQWIHRTDKNSRIESSKNAVDILKGENLFAMYPEATWNLSPNLLMLPMNYGCIRMALEANVPIIPVVSFFGEDYRHTIIGKEFYPTDNLEKSVNTLRDIMATTIYEETENDYQRKKDSSSVYETIVDGEYYLYEKREDLDLDYWKKHIDKRYSVYERANNDKSGVREFESQFVFTPKTDDYSFFQEFNSIQKIIDGGVKIKRISSENKGYDDSEFNDYFEYGYNESVLKRALNKK